MWSTESLQNNVFHNNEGQEITFKFDFDIENNSKMKSLWIVHKLRSFIGEEFVGFMTISYIPEDAWNVAIENKPLSPEIMASEYFGGTSLGIKHRREFPSECSILQKLSLTVAFDMHNVFTEYNVGTSEYNDAKDFVIKQSIKKHEEKYHNSYNFHVDKPLVDFIQTNNEYQRQGIGHTLYYAMALIVAENGYKMRSSGVKTGDGDAHFNSFAKHYPETVIEEDGYYFIDVSHV